MGEVAFPREKHTNRLSIGQTISPENIHAGITIWTGQVVLRNAIITSEKRGHEYDSKQGEVHRRKGQM